MTKLKPKPQIFYDEDGNKTGVLLTVQEFESLIHELEDLHDLKIVYKRVGKKSKTIPYEKIKQEMFGSDARK